VPIVFPIISDPVAAGYVDSMARPGGGNATSFMSTEYSIGGKSAFEFCVVVRYTSTSTDGRLSRGEPPASVPGDKLTTRNFGKCTRVQKRLNKNLSPPNGA
jgi:hypothetical protein